MFNKLSNKKYLLLTSFSGEFFRFAVHFLQNSTQHKLDEYHISGLFAFYKATDTDGIFTLLTHEPK